MRILGIESSCDDSSVALLDMRRGSVFSIEQLVASQDIHRKYGGVVPEMAAREHSATLPPLLAALADRVTGSTDGNALGATVDAIAVTGGPGLATSLRVGVDTARGLAIAWRKPMYLMNHMEGHVYANWLPSKNAALTVRSRVFPAIVMVVSGGHTEILLMTAHGRYQLLGATRDDAAGEAFDKTAKLMGLGYPGGPAIAKLATKGNPAAFSFPRPMKDAAHLDMSFSGLKTAVRYFLRENESRLGDEQFVSDVAASVQQAIVDVLVEKTVRAATKKKVRTVLLAGGVAANGLLRTSLRDRLAVEAPAIRFIEPALPYCTDNAAMIAMAAYFRSQRSKNGDPWQRADANPDWELGRV